MKNKPLQPRATLLSAILEAMKQFHLARRPSTPSQPAHPTPPRTPGEATNEDVRRSIAALHGIDPADVTDKMVGRIRREMKKEAEKEADMLAMRVGAYIKLFTRLGLPVGQVHSYMTQERRLLGSMYYQAREPRPSPDGLRRLAIQLALDVRKPIAGSLRSIRIMHDNSGWRVEDYRGIHASSVLPPPGGFVTAISPFADQVLPYVDPPEQNIPHLINWIEVEFGGVPSRTETLEAVNTRELRFQVSEGHLRLWIADTEIKGLVTKDEQAFLRYFCENPKARISGPALRKKLGVHAINNPSQAARRIRQALEAVLPEAVDWLATDPLRWADGVRVLRSTKRSARPCPK